MSAHSPSHVLWKRASRGVILIAALAVGIYSGGHVVYGTLQPGVVKAVVLLPVFLTVTIAAAIGWYAALVWVAMRLLTAITEVRQ